MIPLSPAFLLAALTTLSELGKAGRATSRRTRRAQAIAGLTDLNDMRKVERVVGAEATDVSVLSCLGFWSHWDHRDRASSWPLPLATTHGHLASFAKTAGILVSAPEPGDLFLSSSPSMPGFFNAGVVAAVRGSGRNSSMHSMYVCDTFGAVASASLYGAVQTRGATADRSRWCIELGRRRFVPAAGDRFVRWVDLDGRAKQYEGIRSPTPAACFGTTALAADTGDLDVA